VVTRETPHERNGGNKMNLEEMTGPQLLALSEAIKAEVERRTSCLMAEVQELRAMIDGTGRGKRIGLEAYRQCAAEGLNMYQTAKRLGVRPNAVYAMRDRHGIEFALGARGKRK
jgi:hypothetical protein